MFKKFFPDLIADSIKDIDFKILIKKNIKGLILDIDNTLVPYHMKEADQNAVAWIESARKAGFKTCIVSNNSRTRVIKFNERLKIPAIHRAFKPGARAFIKAARLMDIKLEETAVIGDQIFTDVLGGKRLGLFVVLVKPIDNNEQPFIRFKRLIERFILKKYTRKNAR